MAKKKSAKKAAPKKAAKQPVKSAPQRLFQFKIELEIVPPIWRRIQVLDCTLDKLHEHIQTAMGWTNSHLHEFTIRDHRYGDPELLIGDDPFCEDDECIDSTQTMLSDLFPTGRQLKFAYVYDFGDNWEHAITFEGNPAIEQDQKYPRCLEGERACPPDDVGGIWGFVEFVEAMADAKHPEHEHFKDWYGRKFDPTAFSPDQATRAMRKGLPNWRLM